MNIQPSSAKYNLWHASECDVGCVSMTTVTSLTAGYLQNDLQIPV